MSPRFKFIYLGILVFFYFSISLFGQLTRDWYEVASNLPFSSNSYLSNNSSILAWGESYYQNGYVDLFETSHDTMWLNDLVIRIDQIMNTMRDVPPDSVLCNRSVYLDGYLGWGTTAYDANGYYQEYMVHDGMIMVPILRFIKLIYEDEYLYSVYGDRANAYLEKIENHIIAKWFVNWEGDTEKSGETIEEWGGWKHLPNNQYLIFGTAMLILHNISENSHYSPADTSYPAFYIEEATNMATTFKSYLFYKTTKDAYLWGYWSTYPPAEDLTHGYLAILFVLEAYHKGIVFDYSDMQKFTNTFTKLIWKNQNIENPFISNIISGTGSENWGYYSWAWTYLAEFDFLVWEIVNAYLEFNFSDPTKIRNYCVAKVGLLTQLYDTYAPAPPNSVVQIQHGSIVDIKWTTSTQDADSTRLTGLAGYNVYRADTPEGPYTKINDSIIKSYEYVGADTSYYYAVTAVDYHYPPNESPYAYVGKLTEINDDIKLSFEFSLSQNYPNPFNPTTEILYSIPKAGYVRLNVYNLLGEEVFRLVDQRQNSGKYKIDFDASKLTSGVYIYKIQVNDFSASRKMILLK